MEEIEEAGEVEVVAMVMANKVKMWWCGDDNEDDEDGGDEEDGDDDEDGGYVDDGGDEEDGGDVDDDIWRISKPPDAVINRSSILLRLEALSQL